MRCREVMQCGAEVGHLDRDARAHVTVHLLWCADCRAYLASMRSVRRLLRDAGTRIAEPDAATLERLARLFDRWSVPAPPAGRNGLPARPIRRAGEET